MANLEAQGFECYLPLMPVEVVRQGSLKVKQQPLFPRYLFARAGQHDAGQNWGVFRSTQGVHHLVTFGTQPAKVHQHLVAAIQESTDQRTQAQAKFIQGEILSITQGPFAGLEAVFDMKVAEDRVMVLINLMSQQVKLAVEPWKLQKV